MDGAPMLRVPYGRGEIEFMVQPWFDIDVVGSAAVPPIADLDRAVREALRSPVGWPPPRELVSGELLDAVLADLAEGAAEMYTRPIAHQYDIAIAGVGYPKDVNLYQASRAATYLRFAPTPVVREGGAIVVPAQLGEGAGEGAGEQRFLAALERAESPAAVVEAARRSFAGGEQRAVMVALTLQHCAIIVAASESPEVVRLAKLRAAVDVEEALDIAYEHIGRPPRASVLLVPRALQTLPVVRDPISA